MTNNIFYSNLNPEILDDKRRLEVAKQIELILKDYLKTKKISNFKILDIGCSSGIISNYFAGIGNKVVGIDIDEKAIALAKKGKNLKIMKMDGQDIRYTNKYFDIVICSQTYCYFQDQAKAFKQILKVLKPGGVCFISGANKLWPFKKKEQYKARYLSFWELKKNCRSFRIFFYTPKILNNPQKYGFKMNYPAAELRGIVSRKFLSRYIVTAQQAARYYVTISLGGWPVFLLRILEPFVPFFFWVLQKPKE